jgi:hypothetical protein
LVQPVAVLLSAASAVNWGKRIGLSPLTCFFADRHADLPGEVHPAIERCGALLATAARLNSQGVGDALDGVTQADLLVNEEARESNAMWLPRGLNGLNWRLSLRSFPFLHDAFLA